MTFNKFSALLCLFLFICSNAFADRYGLMMENSLGHIPTNGEKTHPTLFSIYYTNKPNINLFNKTWGLHTSLGFLNSIESEIGLKSSFFNYGNKRYFLSFGAVIAYCEDDNYLESQSNVGGSAFLRMDYEEELTLGLYFTAGLRLDSNVIYNNDSWVPRLSIGLKSFIDNEIINDEIVRMTYVDVDKIIEENQKYNANEIRIDRSKEIEKLKNISKGKALILPKFVKKGTPFIIKKIFDSSAEIARVNCKVDGIKNTLYKFTEVEPNVWAARIIIPKSFTLSQINLTLYAKRSDGSKFEEYATTLVE